MKKIIIKILAVICVISLFTACTGSQQEDINITSSQETTLINSEEEISEDTKTQETLEVNTEFQELHDKYLARMIYILGTEFKEGQENPLFSAENLIFAKSTLENLYFIENNESVQHEEGYVFIEDYADIAEKYFYIDKEDFINIMKSDYNYLPQTQQILMSDGLGSVVSTEIIEYEYRDNLLIIKYKMGVPEPQGDGEYLMINYNINELTIEISDDESYKYLSNIILEEVEKIDTIVNKLIEENNLTEVNAVDINLVMDKLQGCWGIDTQIIDDALFYNFYKEGDANIVTMFYIGGPDLGVQTFLKSEIEDILQDENGNYYIILNATRNTSKEHNGVIYISSLDSSENKIYINDVEHLYYSDSPEKAVEDFLDVNN